jgi:hypothetical protein
MQISVKHSVYFIPYLNTTLSRDVATDAGFLYDYAAVLSCGIKGTV